MKKDKIVDKNIRKRCDKLIKDSEKFIVEANALKEDLKRRIDEKEENEE